MARSFPFRDGDVGAFAKYVSRCDRGSGIGGVLDVPIRQLY